MNFYLEARAWPAEFIFDHEQKIATFTDAGCPLSALPQRASKPYLWKPFVLWLPDRRIGTAIVDQPHPSAFSQLRQFVRQFLPALRYMQEELELLVVTGSQHRSRLYGRRLQHPAIRKLGVIEFGTKIKPYCVRQPMPSITALLWPRSGEHKAFLDLAQDSHSKGLNPFVCRFRRSACDRAFRSAVLREPSALPVYSSSLPMNGVTVLVPCNNR